MKSSSVLLGALAAIMVSGSRASESPSGAPDHVKQLDLIHFSHTDYGFTDHPAVCRDMQVRYLDIALDAALATRELPEAARFRWTAETTIAVNDWWQAALPARRAQLLEAIRAGQVEITALPFNNTPYLNQAQWEVLMRWLPDELWRECKPQSAIQNDVNGFPRAGAKVLLDRGVRYLFSGINSDSGGPPLPRLTAFWWKQPDGRRLFVWMSLSYGDGFFFFETEEWRRGPLPLAADARFRPPRAGDILRTDEASLRRAHQQCVRRIREFEQAGYRHGVMVLSMTSMWRYDNDPPFPPLSDFVSAWNRLDLQPRLRLATVSEAMKHLEQEAGPTAPEFQGEWTDWWANGTMCAPREVAANRFAKRYLAAAQSPVWGPLDKPAQERIEELTRELCLFDEHTWGSGMSVGQPYSLDAQGQWNEKARLAWRPMALAEWLLGRRARSRLAPEGEGLWLANPASRPFNGWATMITSCLRDDYRSLVDPGTGARIKLYFEPGPVWGRPQKPEDLSREDVSATFPDQVPKRFARFWVENLPAENVKKFELSKMPVEDAAAEGQGGAAPRVSLDDQGWPAAATWPGMSKPLFTAGQGDFVSVTVNAFAPRWALQDIWQAGDPSERQQMQNKMLQFITATAVEKASRVETPHTLRYTQALGHPRLKWATRRLELWKREPRARLTFRLNRISSFDPELLCIVNPMPCDGALPRFSSGGMNFTPFTDQLPGTCRDYFAIDGWAHYATPEGHWLWVSRDAPLVTLDGPHPKSHLDAPPPRTGRVVAIVFDNFWYTNFQGDSPGVMEFQFDLVWRKSLEGEAEAVQLAESLVGEPVMVLNPGLPEQPLYLQHLYRP
jgi:hypothetical protein